MSKIRKVPDQFIINETEKLKCSTGDTIDIDIRYNKSNEKYFFKSSDVSDKFDLIRDDSNYGYCNDIDYVYFKNKSKNELYLTYTGFAKLVDTDMYGMSESLKNIIIEWLKKFKGNEIYDRSDNKMGFVYIITSDNLNAVKIGYWTGSLQNLKKRYVTYYGSSTVIHTITSYNAPKLEKKLFKHFTNKRLENELFDKKYLNQYIQYANKYDDKVSVLCSNKRNLLSSYYTILSKPVYMFFDTMRKTSKNDLIDFGIPCNIFSFLKANLKRTLLKYHIENIDYFIEKIKVKNSVRSGANYVDKILITRNCFTDLALSLHADSAKEIRRCIGSLNINYDIIN